MWCDNCLLLFPLRHGAMALAAFVGIYNCAGAIFLFQRGETLFFNYPEGQIYGGIGMAVMAMCIITLIAFSSQSYMLIRLLFYVWPFILITVAVRAAVMLFQLMRQKRNIYWECDHDRIAYTQDAYDQSVAGTLNTDGYEGYKIPAAFCNAGFNSIYTAFVFCLVIDFVLLLYSYFMAWRLKVKTEHRYQEVARKSGGIYGP